MQNNYDGVFKGIIDTTDLGSNPFCQILKQFSSTLMGQGTNCFIFCFFFLKIKECLKTFNKFSNPSIGDKFFSPKLIQPFCPQCFIGRHKE